MNPDTSTALRDAPSLTTIETCHSTWQFDEANHRFRRMLRHRLVQDVSTEWRAYDRLVADPSWTAFVVLVDRARSRVLVGRRCGDECRCREGAAGRDAERTSPAASVRGSGAWLPGYAAGAMAGARIIPLPLPGPGDAADRSLRLVRS